MKRIIIFIITVIMVLNIFGCRSEESGELIVYSFNGENDYLEISNGVIVIDNDGEIFHGGDLNVNEEQFLNVSSYCTTFYTITGDEERTILSNNVTDMTGNSVNISGDLGQVSGDGILLKSKVASADALKSILYFELLTIDKSGNQNIYQLQMNVKEITKD